MLTLLLNLGYFLLVFWFFALVFRSKELRNVLEEESSLLWVDVKHYIKEAWRRLRRLPKRE